MATAGLETNFNSLYSLLMKTNFLAASTPAFGAKPTSSKVTGMVSKSAPLLPAPFQAGYVTPLLDRAASIFARIAPGDVSYVETLTGCVYQHSDKTIAPEMNRFLAVISDLYVSFLNKSTRRNLGIKLSEQLPPLAVYQSDPSQGPFTVPCDDIANLTGGNIGVVSMPSTFMDHPFLFGSLAHETGGHDVIHADHGLMQELRQQVYSVFPASADQWKAVLWDYWMDEAAADIYGVLNMGPSFGYNLAMLLAVFIGQFAKPKAKTPALRNASGTDENGDFDVHPTDLLRLGLIQGAVETLSGLNQSTRNSYIDELTALGAFLGTGATTIELMGTATGINGQTVNFQQEYPIADMQDSARKVGAMIATAQLAALGGHSVQDIETWDDGDENTTLSIAGRLQNGFPVVGNGDDAQLLAGFTLAVAQQPAQYAAFTTLISAALDGSFANDPIWGTGSKDMMIVKPVRRLHKNPEIQVDPLAAKVIDFNPLDQDAMAAPGLGFGVTVVNQHSIAPIPWPANLSPQPDSSFKFKSSDAELPQADFVIFTWTSAEANAMAAALTPGTWAMPAKGATSGWYEYTNQWDSKFAGRSTGRAPAAEAHYIGKFMPILIGGRKVLLFKSNFHLARDNASMPVKDMFKQVIQQAQPKLAITSGTAGAIGAKLELGDVIVANTAVFKLDKNFKSAAFNHKSFSSGYTVPTNGQLTQFSRLTAPNVAQVKAAHAAYGQAVKTFTRNPGVFTAANTAAQIGGPAVIVTTDAFEFDTAQNSFGLQKMGAMVEMDDAILGLAVDEMKSDVKWLAIRNASDPQMPTKDGGLSTDIYDQYGYWTSLGSTIASWACVLDYKG